MGRTEVQHASVPLQSEFDFGQTGPIKTRPRKPDRLFYALFPDPETSLSIDRFRNQFIYENHLTGALIKTERLHVSLHHVGDYKRLRTKFTYAAELAGKTVSMRPFEINFRFIKTLQSAPSFNGRPARRPLVLLGEGDKPLFELHSMLGAAMAKNGLRAAEYFLPHMTLLYGSTAVPVQLIEPIRFTAREFKLIHSELGLTQYHEKGSWPFET
jgi:2'-5' RNA ligase